MFLQSTKSFVSNIITTKFPRALLPPGRRYRRDGHNELLFADLRLNAESVVLDFGGYIGDFTSEIRERFDSEVHVFEPVLQFYESLEVRFKEDSKVHLHNFAVGSESGEISLILQGEATSHVGNGTSVTCTVFNPIDTFLKDIGDIALVAINIEGGEYDLIPALNNAGILKRTDQLLVQYHRVGSGYHEQQERCTEILRKTHAINWSYSYVWESWQSRI